MDRRNFIKSGFLTATAGALNGPKAIAQEAEKRAIEEQLSKTSSITIHKCNIAQWDKLE